MRSVKQYYSRRYYMETDICHSSLGISGTFPTPGFGGSCVAYGRQFRYQDDNGTPLAFGPKGTTTAQAGFCYAVLNMTSAYGSEATCPVDRNGKPNSGFDSSTGYDFSWSTTNNRCTYAKGIKGYLNAALTKADNTTYAAGLFKDMSVYATMGDCLTNGGTWNNWVGQPLLGTTAVATTPSPASNSLIPRWDLTKQAPETTQGCLHCHSTLTQYNGPFERQKDTYLNHGHRNILRKVTALKKWAGPDADGVLEFYTSAASGPIDFDAATAKIDGVDKPLLYIFGDWMTAAPGGLHTIVDILGAAKADGTSSELCASCHTKADWEYRAAHPLDKRFVPKTDRVHVCEKCGREFVAKGHKAKRCENCWTRICQNCGKSYRPRLWKTNLKFCSGGCHHAYRGRHRSAQADDRAGRAKSRSEAIRTYTCKECGEFFVPKDGSLAHVGKHPPKYCSRACLYAGQRTRVTLTCRQCGKLFERKAYMLDWSTERGPFCGFLCYGKWQSINLGRGFREPVARFGDIRGRG